MGKTESTVDEVKRLIREPLEGTLGQTMITAHEAGAVMNLEEDFSGPEIHRYFMAYLYGLTGALIAVATEVDELKARLAAIEGNQ